MTIRFASWWKKPFSARERKGPKAFHGRFLRWKMLLPQNCAILHNAVQIEPVRLPYEKHAVQRSENMRKKFFLN